MEYVDLARFVFSFAGVIALILLVAWITKRLGIEKRLAGLRKNALVSVTETCHIDARHKLVVVRRGDRHHLLVVGQGATLLVESFDAPKAEVPHVES